MFCHVTCIVTVFVLAKSTLPAYAHTHKTNKLYLMELCAEILYLPPVIYIKPKQEIQTMPCHRSADQIEGRGHDW